MILAFLQKPFPRRGHVEKTLRIYNLDPPTIFAEYVFVAVGSDLPTEGKRAFPDN